MARKLRPIRPKRAKRRSASRKKSRRYRPSLSLLERLAIYHNLGKKVKVESVKEEMADIKEGNPVIDLTQEMDIAEVKNAISDPLPDDDVLEIVRGTPSRQASQRLRIGGSAIEAVTASKFEDLNSGVAPVTPDVDVVRRAPRQTYQHSGDIYGDSEINSIEPLGFPFWD